MKKTFDFNLFRQKGSLNEDPLHSADLHLHSFYSDGFVKPKYYVDIYQQNKSYSYLSITDHNTLKPYVDKGFLDNVTSSQATIIPGVEIDCHSSMDILLYAKSSDATEPFIDEVTKILSKENTFRQECMRQSLYELHKFLVVNTAPDWFDKGRFEKEYQQLLTLDKILEVDFFSKSFTLPKRDYVSKPHLILALISLEIINISKVPGTRFKEQHKVIKEWLFDKTLKWTPDHMTVDLKLIDQIANLKYGVSIVAHPGKTIEELQSLTIAQPVLHETLESMLDNLLKLGIQGVEMEYRNYGANNEYYNKIVLSYVSEILRKGETIFTTAGSDFHGPPEVSF